MLRLQELSLCYGDKVAVTNASITLESGQIGSPLGPSGCGKSTLLRGIAGFERPMTGTVTIDGRVLSKPEAVVAPENRRIGMVFQDFALFPHIDVRRNIAFGLRGTAKAERYRRADELLELFGLAGYGERMPHSLSGGEQQRVALARAMAPRPNLLLMDEAFSSLDTELRLALVPEVRRILKHESMSAILVTHDQDEAFAMADRIGVMDAGYIHQWDEPHTVYQLPGTRFVARFVGVGQLIQATAIDGTRLRSALGIHSVHEGHGIEPGRGVEILVRPDDIVHEHSSDLMGEVIERSYRGSHYQYLVQLEDGERLYCLAGSHVRRQTGDRLELVPRLERLVVFGEDGLSKVYDSTLDTFLRTLSVNPFL